MLKSVWPWSAVGGGKNGNGNNERNTTKLAKVALDSSEHFRASQRTSGHPWAEGGGARHTTNLNATYKRLSRCFRDAA